ncbi:MAG: sigma-54-dependent Fis family transcriptional regulator [Planctomycetes bacterium]|nr:sigma-54-dependent Fis family transcriptional regulator [Planctomycetota bacterium]
MLDILIVEDDPASRTALAEWLARQGMTCRTACDLASARLALVDDAPDLALIDLELPDGSGLQLLSVLGELPETDVVMISGKTTVETAIEALRLGARDFLTKPVALPRLTEILKRFSVTATRRHELRRVREELQEAGRFGDIVGVSPAMRRIYGAIERVAPTDETVFVIGPTGTGKELVAAMLHRLSLRASGPFVALNCGSVSASLIESELFGHERGSFTGAHRLHQGVFERAQGGTLFLDEVTEMPPDMQVRLLRVLESGKLTRVGGSGEIELDVRIVASTNRDPHDAVESGVLRQDLLYRLHVFPLRLPPLSERGGDIRLLAESFLRELNEEMQTGKTFSPAALQALEAWSWPGNVRELRNVVRRAWIMSGEVVDVGDVMLGDAAAGKAPPGPDFVLRAGTSIESAEKQLIEATLVYVDGDKRKAAGLLGISLKTLYTRLGLYAAGAG